MLFFAFEYAVTPGKVLGPLLAEFWRYRTAEGKSFNIWGVSPEKDTYYYGHADVAVMADLREMLRQQGLVFTEVDESELPEWGRHRLTELRGH